SVVSLVFNDTPTTEIYTLSLHDALPILLMCVCFCLSLCVCVCVCVMEGFLRSEEHTSELQSHLNLVCRLLLENIKVSAILISTKDDLFATYTDLLLSTSS